MYVHDWSKSITLFFIVLTLSKLCLKMAECTGFAEVQEIIIERK